MSQDFNPRANLLYLFHSLSCQLISLFFAALINYAFSNFALFIILHSLLAYLTSTFLKLPVGWRLFNLLLLPAVIVASGQMLPGWVFAALGLVSALIFIPTLWTRVPYYPTSNASYNLILEELPSGRSFTFIDIGCGFSELLLYLSKHHPESSFYGAEISPLAYIVSKIKSLTRPNVSIYFKSFWKIDFSAYDVVYAFLAPPPMADLWEKLKKEMKPGSLFISNTFEVPAKPDKTIEVPDSRRAKLMIFSFPTT